MTAAAKTPSVVMKRTGEVFDTVTGTAIRTEIFKLKTTKATQNDWIVLTTALGSNYTTDKVVGMSGIVIPSGGDSSQETITLDDSEDYVILAGAAVGTSWIEVEIQVD